MYNLILIINSIFLFVSFIAIYIHFDIKRKNNIKWEEFLRLKDKELTDLTRETLNLTRETLKDLYNLTSIYIDSYNNGIEKNKNEWILYNDDNLKKTMELIKKHQDNIYKSLIKFEVSEMTILNVKEDNVTTN